MKLIKTKTFTATNEILEIGCGDLATIGVDVGELWPLPSPCYTGRIDGIWALAQGAAKLTEVA